jgi:hypothetical protein
LVVALIAVMGSCSINHRSDQFACTKNTDCDGGRVCNDGFCIVAGSIDAPKNDGTPGDSATCPFPCTSCNTTQKTCTVNCNNVSCKQPLACPAGYRCTFQCNAEDACRQGINCSQAAACNIECTARSTCEQITCGPGPCDVGCSGVQSCKDISCGSSCACDVLCTGGQSCSDGIACSSLACRSGSGCTSVPALCHSCP